VTFKYARYSPDILRPVIPIAVHHGARVADYEVLIDSGADINLFAYQLGEYLGLDVRSGVVATMAGVTGQPEKFYFHPIAIELGGQTFEVQAGFSESMNNKPHGIVGQQGFFDLFKVTFDLANEEIELRHN
jgi:hypothetical protein